MFESLTPPPSVRVATGTLDRFLSTVGEVILSSSQLRTTSATGGGSAPGFSASLDQMDRVVGELQRRALELRTTPLERIVDVLPRVAREIAQRLGKRVEVEILRADVEIDRSILDRLSDPLLHLIRNAVDHGIESPEDRVAAGKPETGLISIDARRDRDSIHIEVRDDGAGIDLDRVRRRAVEAGLLIAEIAEDLPSEEIAEYIFHPGLSTAHSVSDVSGRGVGMDAVRATVQGLGGEVELVTEVGRGTKTTLVVPITAAVQRVLLLQVASEIVAIPVGRVERILEVDAGAIEKSGLESFTLIDGDPTPVCDLAERVSLAGVAEPGSTGRTERVTLVLLHAREEILAMRVDRVAGQEQIYVKPVPELLHGVRALAGLTLLGDGRPVFLLDLNQIT